VRVANNILNLEAGVECVLIGTLYKHMQLKPSALAEYAQEVKASARLLAIAPPLSHPPTAMEVLRAILL
jgi:hypothetical protein